MTSGFWWFTTSRSFVYAALPYSTQHHNHIHLVTFAPSSPHLPQIVGPHGHLQLVLACGLFAQWKMPVLFAFDQPATKDFIVRAILSVEAAGGRVVSLVSDMGGANMGLWRDLGISHDAEVSFLNPADLVRGSWYEVRFRCLSLKRVTLDRDHCKATINAERM